MLEQNLKISVIMACYNSADFVESSIESVLNQTYQTSSIEAKQKWGLQTIMSFIAKSENLDLLHRLYNFSYKDYMGYASLVRQSTNQAEPPFLKYKRKIHKLKKIIIILFVICLIFGALLCL